MILPRQLDSMSRVPPLDYRRVARYVAVAALLALVVGIFQQGSVAAGILFGVTVGVGVAIGLLCFELVERARST